VHRVAVWSTGWIGTIAIRAIRRRSDLELVGVRVHSPDKDGKDAGELAGIAPIGLAATNDVDAILAERPDCVVYAASGPELDAAAVPDYVRLLEAGVNVVTVTSWGLVYPPAFEAAWLAQLAEAADRGGTSLYASGIEPGFAADQLPLVLATMSNTITSVRSSELFLYDQYPVEFILREAMGFGRPPEDTPLLALEGAQTATWGPSIRLVAAEWPIGERDGTYRVSITGDPHIECTMTVGDPGAATAGAMVATAMRIVNAVPHVVAAPPGLVSSLDLPLTVPYRPIP
jgi:hypothetical protein